MILKCINAGSCKLLTQDKLYYGEPRDNDGRNAYYKIKRDDGSVNTYKSNKFKEIKYKVYKNTYKKNEILIDDLIQIGNTTQKPKQKRIETYDEITGEKKYSYKPIEGEYNDWLLGWKKIN